MLEKCLKKIDYTVRYKIRLLLIFLILQVEIQVQGIKKKSWKITIQISQQSDNLSV